MTPENLLYNTMDKIKPASIMSMCRYLYKNGGFDFTKNVGGFPFLLHWLRDENVSLQLTPDDIIFIDESTNGQAMVIQDMHKKTLLDFVLNAERREKQTDEETDKLVNEVLRRTPSVPEISLYLNQTGSFSVFQTLIEFDLIESVKTYMEKTGARLTEAKNGYPIAKHICSKQMWDLFILQGGNPEMNTKEGAEEPLWKYLKRISSNTELISSINEWCEQNIQGKLNAHNEALYWNGIANAWTAQAVAQKMKAFDEWEKKRDSEGRTPMMAAVARNAASYSSFKENKRVQPYLTEKDNKGLTLWFYAISGNPDKVPAGFYKWLSKKAPPSPDNEGRGFVLQLLHYRKDPVLRFGYGNNKSDIEEIATSAAKHPGFMWGGTDEQKDTFADWLANDFQRGRHAKSPTVAESAPELAKMLVTILKTSPDDFFNSSPTPKMMGAMVAMFVLDYETSSPLVDRLLDNGAILDFDMHAVVGNGSSWADFFNQRASSRQGEIFAKSDMNKLKLKSEAEAVGLKERYVTENTPRAGASRGL